jgi:hypothetical protein
MGKAAEEGDSVEGESAAGRALEDDPSKFECNICLEKAFSCPVVTLCGHLYCRQCILCWLAEGHSTCPVCKSTVRQCALIHIGQHDRREHSSDAELILRKYHTPASKTSEALHRTSSAARAWFDAAIASNDNDRQNLFLARLFPTLAAFVVVCFRCAPSLASLLSVRLRSKCMSLCLRPLQCSPDRANQTHPTAKAFVTYSVMRGVADGMVSGHPRVEALERGSQPARSGQSWSFIQTVTPWP